MKDSVIIKGNKHGLSVFIKEGVTFEQITNDLINKLDGGRNFFGTNKVTLTFEGTHLSVSAQDEIINLFAQHSDLTVVCVVDPEEERNKLREANKLLTQQIIDLELKSKELESALSLGRNVPQPIYDKRIADEQNLENNVYFHYTTLRSGQQIIKEHHVIVMGDVNNGSRIEAGGNVIILGKLKGVVHAGLSSQNEAFIVALDMKPVQLRIKDDYGRASDETISKSSKTEPKIAYVENGRIVIELINNKILKDIKLN